MIHAWEAYIKPIGAYIRAYDIFDATLDDTVANLKTAIEAFQASGAQWDIQRNIHYQNEKISDMRGILLDTYTDQTLKNIGLRIHGQMYISGQNRPGP